MKLSQYISELQKLSDIQKKGPKNFKVRPAVESFLEDLAKSDRPNLAATEAMMLL